MNFYVVRHGETAENVSGVVQGWYNSQLNENGLRQAEESAARFNEPIDLIVTSDLDRCMRTAEFFIEKYAGVSVLIDWRLRERCFGEAQNTRKENHDWEIFWSLDDSVSIPGAETFDAFQARVKSFIESMRQLNKPNDNVLVVTHGGVVNQLLALTSEDYSYFPVENASMTKIEI